MTIIVRQARDEELDTLGEITAQAYLTDGHMPPGDWYEPVLRNTRDRAARAELLVAMDANGGEPLGCVAFTPPGGTYSEVARATEGEFRMLAVAPTARGRGAGAALVRACLDRAAELGLTAVAISTLARMDRAHRIYERLGFTRAPDRDWSPSPGVDLWVYTAPVHASHPG